MSYATEITETFSSAGSPPTNWTERNGSYTCDGTNLAVDDSTTNRCITHDTELSHLNHWVKVELDTYPLNSYDGVVLRSPDATYGPRYMIRVDNTEYYEMRVCGNGSNSHLCSTFHEITVDQNYSAGDYLAVLVTGTGASTEFKIWKNPSGADPDDWGEADYTINSTNWDGAPGTYCDTGKYVGLYNGSAKSACCDWDNFTAGAEAAGGTAYERSIAGIMGALAGGLDRSFTAKRKPLGSLAEPSGVISRAASLSRKMQGEI